MRNNPVWFRPPLSWEAPQAGFLNWNTDGSSLGKVF